MSIDHSRVNYDCRRLALAVTKLTKLELRIMEAFWTLGPCSVREVLEAFPEEGRPAYTTVQTVIYRLEAKKALRRTKKIGTAYVFEAAVSRASAQRRLIHDVLALFDGRTQPVMAALIQTGQLTREDVRAAERLLDELEAKGKTP
jgi:BlaI family penicillinase repressor